MIKQLALGQPHLARNNKHEQVCEEQEDEIQKDACIHEILVLLDVPLALFVALRRCSHRQQVVTPVLCTLLVQLIRWIGAL